MKRVLSLLLLLLSFQLLTSQCASPVQKVLADKELFAQVRDSVFAQGLCLNDTIKTQTVKDTTIYRDTTIVQRVVVRVPEVCRIDTVVNGTRVILADGVLTVQTPSKVKEKLRTVYHTNTVRDKAREQVLEKIAAQQKEQLVQLKQALALVEEKRKLAQLKFLLVLILLLGLSIFEIRQRFFAKAT